MSMDELGFYSRSADPSNQTVGGCRQRQLGVARVPHRGLPGAALLLGGIATLFIVLIFESAAALALPKTNVALRN